MTFQKHDEVLLCLGPSVVGAGTLQKVLPNDILQGVPLGDGRFAVYVDNAFDSECDIPYPIKHAEKLKDKKDFVIIWDSADVHHRLKPSRRNNDLHDGEDPSIVLDSQLAHDQNVDILIPDSQGIHGLQQDAHPTIPNSQVDPHLWVFGSGCESGNPIEE